MHLINILFFFQTTGISKISNIYLFFQTTGKSKILRNVLEIYNKLLICNITTLKDKQEEALNCFVHEGRDVISMLPTGYGKSLIIELLPIACKEELSVDAFVIVIEPLNVIIEQQKKKTRRYVRYLLTRKFNRN